MNTNLRLYGKLGSSDSLWSLGRTTSIESLLGSSLGATPFLMIRVLTFSLVLSLAETYGFGGSVMAFGRIFAFSSGESTTSSTTFGCSVLRLPNAVTGSGIRLGLGTHGTFSHGISRFCKNEGIIGVVRPSPAHRRTLQAGEWHTSLPRRNSNPMHQMKISHSPRYSTPFHTTAHTKHLSRQGPTSFTRCTYPRFIEGDNPWKGGGVMQR